MPVVFLGKMRPIAAIALLISTALAVGMPSAQAQGRNALNKCFGPGPLTQAELEMQCVKVEGGEWTAVGGDNQNNGSAGLFLLALVFSLIPAFVGLWIADMKNVSPALGFLAGLAFSWLGVFGTYLYGDALKKRSTPA